MTFEEFKTNYDGCIYIVSFEEETAFAIWQHYFMNYENAFNYLWDYYVSHYKPDLDEDDLEHQKWILITTGCIEGVGRIDEQYFEDFE